jgi:hypothetical protein
VKNLRPAGYAGKLGYASAGALADFIVTNMVAEAASGSKTPKEAAERAQKRAERYYKVLPARSGLEAAAWSDRLARWGARAGSTAIA